MLEVAAVLAFVAIACVLVAVILLIPLPDAAPAPRARRRPLDPIAAPVTKVRVVFADAGPRSVTLDAVVVETGELVTLEVGRLASWLPDLVDTTLARWTFLGAVISVSTAGRNRVRLAGDDALLELPLLGTRGSVVGRFDPPPPTFHRREVGDA